MNIPKPSKIVTNLGDKYVSAYQAGEIPFWIVFIITVYTPFEEFILKWLPLSGLFRFVPEVTLYGLMLKILLGRYLGKGRLKSTPIDLLLCFFFIATAISMIVNGSGIFPSIERLRVLWRYLSVFYIIVNIEISINQLVLMLQGVKVVGILQGLLASCQYFMPESIQKIFAPAKVEIAGYERDSAAEEGEIKAGAVFGTFQQPAVLGSFLLLAFIVFTSRFYPNTGNLIFKAKGLSGIIILVFGIFASKKRIALLLALVSQMILLFFKRRIRTAFKLGWIYAAGLFLIVLFLSFLGHNIDTSFSGADSRDQTIDIVSYFSQLFSPEYYEQSSENSRGWAIKTIFTTVFQSGSWFGFGPDLENTRSIIFDLLVDGADRARIYALDPIEDVYWVAMLAYFGPIGLGIYGFIMWRLFKAALWLIKYSDISEYRNLGSMFCTLVIIVIIYNSASRLILFRPFSLCFWLFAGLVVNVYNQQRIEKTSALLHRSLEK